MLAALVVIGGWWFTRQRGGDEVAAEAAKASLAVAPFTALSTGADDRYLAAGLTEELVAHLTAIPQLSVSSRSAAAPPGQPLGHRETAAALGAEHLVEGTVRRAGQRLRVTARLIRAADRTPLWSGSYDSGQGDMLDVQAQIAAKVAAALNVLLSPSARQQMARMRVRNPDAYVALAKGNEAYDRAHAGADIFPLLVEANRHYDQAFRLARRCGRRANEAPISTPTCCSPI